MDLYSKKDSNPLAKALVATLQKFGLAKDSRYFYKNGIHFLNIAQFLGVINDNVFKFLIVFLFISIKGVEASSQILFWVGTIYVLPFLLFSSAAGSIADHFSKQRLIIILKGMEIIVMLLGVVAFAYKSEWASYTLLFLLSVQSAVFSPPKYSIIPELVEPKNISKANGLITAFTYLAIIVGTFLASFLTQITHKNFVLTASVCVVIAALGFLASFCIPYTTPKYSGRRINPLFVYEIYKTLKSTRSNVNLFYAIFGTSFFLFIGAYFQLNVVPFAIQALGMSEVGGGYLFLITAIGIAFGSIIAGRLCRKRVELGLSLLAGFTLALTVFLLYAFSSSMLIVFLLLLLVGIVGGMFIVPFDSYIQTHAHEEKRGQVIAASNFLSFCGVLLAPFIIYLFGAILGLKAATGFLIVGILIFFYTLFLTSNLPYFFMSYIARLFVAPFISYEPQKLFSNKKKRPILILKGFSLKNLLILTLCFEDAPRFFLLEEKRGFFLSLIKCFTPIHVITPRRNLLRLIEKRMRINEFPLIFYNVKPGQEALEILKDQDEFEIVFANLESRPLSKHGLKKEIVLQVINPAE